MTRSRYEKVDNVLSRKERVVLSTLLVLAGILTILDVYEDWLDGAPLAHIIPEVGIILLSLGIGVYLIKHMLVRRKELIHSSREKAEHAEQTAQEWKDKAQHLSTGITEAIEGQFSKWGFTPAEKEVAFLLLKGLSIAEIAEVRNTTERTVRHQASELYKKGDLSGRAQLSAYFLEDLFDRSILQSDD